MKNAFVIHGSNADKDDHWFPWLEEKLEEEGYEVIRPQFPLEEKQTLSNWLETLEPHKEKLEESVVFAHSLGVPFMLNVLNRWDAHCKSVFLVSGFVGSLEVEGEPNVDDFAEREFGWEKIKKSADTFEIIHSDNDPYVPLDKAKYLGEKLDTFVKVVEGAEHFQASSGYEEFDLLARQVENLD